MPLWALILFGLIFVWLALYCVLDPQRRYSTKQLIEKAKESALDPSTGKPKVVVITGSTNGIGLYAARELAGAGWNVIMANRSVERNNAAVKEITKKYPKAQVTTLICDLSDFDSVVKFVEDFKKLNLPINVLVGNAGISLYGEKGFKLTKQNLEPTFATNHVGHALLVKLLLPIIQKTEEARIVITASDVHDPRNRNIPGPKPFLDWENLNGEKKPFNGFFHYKQSKICNILYTYELVRKLESKKEGKKNIPTVTTFTPGFIPSTGLAGATMSDWQKKLFVFFLDVILGCLHITFSIADGGDMILMLAAHPAFTKVTAKYFAYFKEVESSPETHDQEKAERLWELTEKIIAPYVKQK